MSGFEILALGASAMQAAGAVAGGIQANQTAKYNAKILDQQARDEIAAASSESNSIRRRAAQETGSQVASVAGSGLLLEGSPADVIAQNAAEMELDAMTALWSGQARATGLNNAARMARYEGRQAMTNGIISGVSSLAMGAANTFGGSMFGGRSLPLGQKGYGMGGAGTSMAGGMRYGGV